MGAKGALIDKKNKEIKEQNVNQDTFIQEVSSKIPSQDGSIIGPSEGAARDESGESFGIDDDGIQGQLLGSSTVESVKAIVHDYMTKVFNYEITSVLIPNLLPARMVKIEVGDIAALTNKYDLKSVEHSITQGGAETIIHCTGMGGIVASTAGVMNKEASKLRDLSNQADDSSTKTPKPVDNP